MDPRFYLPDDRLEAIVAEALAGMRANEDRTLEERMNGYRCMCCDCPTVPIQVGETRECDDCAGWH